ncbi:L-alanine-DL-glutamate epimerase-like enolase superfamily enzyme [Microbacterium sp. AG1240]|uniref:dipeptide epimerase n=1 Tax=Microbacterium sp. AG1240 TaxID=2183992 RepID=UPI000F0FA07B|nr:dipeptide epimerase [Microbacterium sp. AG1240]RKT31505.1 L-alanine-DL-glutamate epimerase-like enolase superfamily enzyme [Microbacterium sp. AG1240]
MAVSHPAGADRTITGLRVEVTSVALKAPFVTSVRRADAAQIVVVEARDAAGRVGMGEAAVSWRVTGESAESVTAAVAGPLSDVVVGRAPDDRALPEDIAVALWGNASARSAVECAVADLRAAQTGSAVWQLLGARSPSLRTDRTLSAASPRELAEAAVGHCEEGFGVLKIKVRASDDAVAGVREVRAAVGDGVRLRIDANQAWRPDEAVRIIREMERAGVDLEFVEQPVAADDLPGLAAVAAAVETPVMADESVRTAADVRAIAERTSVSLVNLKLAKAGGLTAAERAAEVARDHGIGVIVGCMLEGPVGITAAAGLAAAVAPEVVHDLDGAHWLVDPLLTDRTAAFSADTILLPSAPGDR